MCYRRPRRHVRMIKLNPPPRISFVASAEIVIAGAGIVGLSLALELHSRGRAVVLLDGAAPGQASTAAAGMLAAHDPANPPQLRPIAEFSLALYPEYLEHLHQLTGTRIPFETSHVLEADPHGQAGAFTLPAIAPSAGEFTLRPEHSLNPRKLMSALRNAVRAAGIPVMQVRMLSTELPRILTTGGIIEAHQFVDCTGAWAGPHLRPVKGQMLRIQLSPNTLRHSKLGNLVVRAPEV